MTAKKVAAKQTKTKSKSAKKGKTNRNDLAPERIAEILRRLEAELVAQVRQRLGDSQFDQAFSAGSRLSQQEAVAIVWDQRDTGTLPP